VRGSDFPIDGAIEVVDIAIDLRGPDPDHGVLEDRSRERVSEGCPERDG